MVNYCPCCGARVLDAGADACALCGETLPGSGRVGLLARLFGWLFGSGGPPRARRRYEVHASRTETFDWTDPVTGQQRTSTNIDDLPPDVRTQVDAARQRALGEGPPSGSRYIFRDPSGQEHTYNTLEEMPEEVRRLFERALKD